MQDNLKKFQFPFYIRRSVYFIGRYFIVKKPGTLFRELHAIKNNKQCKAFSADRCICESDLRPFLRNRNFREPPEKYLMDIFFDNMLSYYTIGRICEALVNLDRYADLAYPANFKLMPGHADYLGTRPDGYELLD